MIVLGIIVFALKLCQWKYGDGKWFAENYGVKDIAQNPFIQNTMRQMSQMRPADEDNQGCINCDTSAEILDAAILKEKTIPFDVNDYTDKSPMQVIIRNFIGFVSALGDSVKTKALLAEIKKFDSGLILIRC